MENKYNHSFNFLGTISICFFCFLFQLQIFGQTPVNINKAGSSPEVEVKATEKAGKSFFKPAKRARTFGLNNSIANPQGLQKGNKVRLQLFNDKDFPSTIVNKTTDRNGITTITVKMDDFNYAFGYITISENSYLLTVDIPERNEKYSSRKNPEDNKNYLFLLDPENLDIIEGCESPPQKEKGKKGKYDIFPAEEPTRDMKSSSVEGSSEETQENNYCLDPGGTNNLMTIDLMIIYTPAAKEWADLYDGGINNTIALSVAKANTVASNSNLGVNFNLAFSGIVDYTEVDPYADLSALTSPNDGVLDEIHDTRKIYGADMVSFFTLTNEVGGLGYLLSNKYGDPDLAFSLTRIQQVSQSFTLIHEIGHNMGIHHYKYQDVQPGPTVWSNWAENTWSGGWRWLSTDSNMYCDVMTYTSGNYYADGMSSISIPYFSDPNHEYIGAQAGNDREGNAAGTIKEIKNVVAQYSSGILYCAAGGDDPQMAAIDNVLLGQISNSSGKDSYSDFSPVTSCIFPQETQTLQVNVSGSSTNKQLLVWVDWNSDKVFDNETELEYSSTENLTEYVTGITAPLGIEPGAKRVRIRLQDNGTGGNNTSCGFSSYGEVEDYTMNVMQPSTCTIASVPQDLQASEIQSTSANISWTPIEGVSSYGLHYRKSGGEDWTEVQNIFYSNYTIDNLDAAAEYEIEVRSQCDANSASDYSTPVIITTAPALAELVFVKQPSDTQAGLGFSVSVEILDATGNRSTSKAEVNLRLIDRNLTGAELLGYPSAKAVDGIATFEGLNLDLAGKYALEASSGELPVVNSNDFTINPYEPVTFIVNSIADLPDADTKDAECADINGQCTLRAAIQNANKTTGRDKVHFNISGAGPHKILLSANLPKILYPLDLNAISQPGYLTGYPQIIVSGENIPEIDHEIREGSIIPREEQAIGFMFSYQSSGSSVKGFAIGGFGKLYDEVYHAGVAIQLDNTTNHVIQGNFIGLHADGETALPNIFGLVTGEAEDLEGNNLIGGPLVEDRNIISGNLRDGLHIGYYGSGNIITNNYFGTNKDGTRAIRNDKGLSIGVWANNNKVSNNLISGNNIGVEIRTHNNFIESNKIGLNAEGNAAVTNHIGIKITGNSNFIGGVNKGNRISGNEYGLLFISEHSSQADNNKVLGNFIGTTLSGNQPLGNSIEGILIRSGSNNIVGGHGSGEKNTIAFNGRSGIAIEANTNVSSVNNIISGNHIYSNSGPGIDLGLNGQTSNDRDDADTGPNKLQNFPDLKNTASLEGNTAKLEYTVSSSSQYAAFPLKVEFFKSDGNGQGKEYLGSDIYRESDISKGNKGKIINLELVPGNSLNGGDKMLATATDAEGNTSEFGNEIDVTGGCAESTWYADKDKDGLGDANDSQTSCTQPEGFVINSDDCDDTNADIAAGFKWYADNDGDGYGDVNDSVDACEKLPNYVSDNTDCDDTDINIYPGAPEICDGKDNNCNGQVDENIETNTYYADSDNDGFGDITSTLDSCSQPDGYVTNSDDCDDKDATVNPGVTDVCKDCDTTNDGSCDVSTECPGTDVLTLSEVCTDASSVYWVINNPGSCEVQVRWEARKTNESGTITVPAGDTFFSTGISSKGPTQVTIYWPDSNGIETKISINSSGITCTSSTKITSSSLEDNFKFSEAGLTVSPNPINAEGIWLHFAPRKSKVTFTATMYDMNGNKLAQKKFAADVSGSSHLWAVNQSRWIPGIYILNAVSGNEVYQIKIIK